MRVHNELISIDGCYQPALPVALNCLQFNRVKKKNHLHGRDDGSGLVRVAYWLALIKPRASFDHSCHVSH